MKTQLCLAAILALFVSYALSCALEFDVAVFSYHRHPDFPRNRFLSGELGILEPAYARSYFVVAYRYLSGASFNAAEREQVVLYWNDRATGEWDANRIEWTERWKKARNRIPSIGEPPTPIPVDQRQYSADTDSWRLNCADDAFRTAILTLQDRTSRYGRNSAYVKDWLHGQDAVFANCSSDGTQMPAPAPARSPVWLQQDRAYQMAAAALYAGDSDAAESGFRQIATDRSSPWHTISPYLVARVLARGAEAGAPANSDPGYQKTEAQVDRILADRSLASIHGMSRALLRRVRIRARPEVAVRDLARAVVQPHDEGSLRQDLWDYTTVLDHFLDDSDIWDTEARKQFDKVSAMLPRRDDITDWIVTMQSKKASDTGHAISRWRQTRSLPWFVAAISRVSGSDAAARELLSVAPLPPDSPAFWMVAFHRNRLLIESGDKAAAKAGLDSLFEGPGSRLPRSVINHFRSLRMLAAPDLAGFLNFAPRIPAMLTSTMNVGETPDGFYAGVTNPKLDPKLPRWDRDSIQVLNERTPLSLWRKAVKSDQVSTDLRQELVLATFARATLLNDDGAISALAPAVSEVFPEARKYMEPIAAESGAEARHYDALYFLLHYANVRPFLTSGVSWHVPSHRTMDSYVNNWWCAVDSPYELDWNGNRNMSWDTPSRGDADVAARRAAFLTAADLNQGKTEFEKLSATGTAPNYLTGQAIRWAREHPADPRNAEALSYAIRSTKYGCTDAQSWRFSRDAFEMLQLKYGSSTWANNTPYWFKTWYPPSPAIP